MLALAPRQALWIAPFVLALATAGSAGADCGGSNCAAGTVADEFMADRAGLIREWIVQLPFDSSRWRVEHVTVGDGLVVAATGDGGLHAVKSFSTGGAAQAVAGEPAVGMVLWSQRPGTLGGPQTPPSIGPQLVTVARDRDVYALDRATGQPRWHEPLGRLPTGGAVQVGDWVYVPQAGGMKRLAADPVRPPVVPAAVGGKAAAARGTKRDRQKAAADARQEAAAAIVEPRRFDAGGRVERAPMPFAAGVVWWTADGNIISLQPGEPTWDRYEFALNAPAIDRPVARGDSIFAVTAAADLARIDLQQAQDGTRGFRAAWHMVLDATPDAGPFLSGDVVVVSLGECGLRAFATETGEPLWGSPIAGTVLAIGGDRVWLIDRVGRLSGIDLLTGERREWFCLGCLTLPVVNTVTDRLVLASPDGLLVSLAPQRPTRGPTPPKKPAAKRRVRPAPVEEPAADQADDAATDAATDAQP